MDSENTGNASEQRHTVEQIQRLESFFKDCSNPDDNQRQELSRELGLDPDQIELWFQNQRNQQKKVMSRTVRDLDKDALLEIGASAMNELVGLLSTTEPVWVASSDGRCVLHRDTYKKIRPMAPISSSPLRPTNARIESSKDSAEVAVAAAELARLLSDPNQRMEMFPTIVSRAKTIQVLDAQNLGGSVHLMFEKIHVLSPHVAAREFVLIRHCRQLSSNSWAVADVSFDLFKNVPEASPVRSWKFPSGCVIRDTSDGKSNVTWVEHVHVDEDKSQNHRLYRDLVRSARAYGAERWIAALRTACERSASSDGPIPPLRHELEWMIATVEGRKNAMRLSNRMVRDFNDHALNMTDGLDFPHMGELHNMTGVRVSMRRNDGPGQPDGLIVAVAASLWLPFSVDFLFNFFNDGTIRAKWDVLANENPMKPIARISTGAHEGSSITFMQPCVPKENKLLILQETVVDSLGASLVYAPIEMRSITSIINGDEDDVTAEMLPSGIVISSDGRVKKDEAEASSSKANNGNNNGTPDGSLVTISIQILASRGERPKGLSMESVATVHSLICATVQNIREALDLED